MKRLIANTVLSMIALAVCLVGPTVSSADEKIKVLIVDGQNNHKAWPNTTKMMQQYLEETGLFSVGVATTAPQGVDPSFSPKFSDYDVVLSNYNGQPWPEKTQAALEKFVGSGGGLVVVHAADNAFPQWKAYNLMIGVGGWGGRNQDSGPAVYVNDDGVEKRDASDGRGGHHGPQSPFQVVTRDASHPITKGLPHAWMHAKDELYDSLRGPATSMTILATAYSAPDNKGTGRHEPMLMTIAYQKGRVFHTALGHAEYSQECVGFITTLQRGTEWVATGKVTQDVPGDFPTATDLKSRPFSK